MIMVNQSQRHASAPAPDDLEIIGANTSQLTREKEKSSQDSSDLELMKELKPLHQIENNSGGPSSFGASFQNYAGAKRINEVLKFNTVKQSQSKQKRANSTKRLKSLNSTHKPFFVSKSQENLSGDSGEETDVLTGDSKGLPSVVGDAEQLAPMARNGKRPNTNLGAESEIINIEDYESELKVPVGSKNQGDQLQSKRLKLSEILSGKPSDSKFKTFNGTQSTDNIIDDHANKEPILVSEQSPVRLNLSDVLTGKTQSGKKKGSRSKDNSSRDDITNGDPFQYDLNSEVDNEFHSDFTNPATPNDFSDSMLVPKPNNSDIEVLSDNALLPKSSYLRQPSEISLGSLSMDDDFAEHKFNRHMHISCLSEDDLTYNVSDISPQKQSSSHVSRRSQSFIFRFRSDKLKSSTTILPKPAGQQTLSFLQPKNQQLDEKRLFFVKFSSPKLKRKTVEQLEEEIYADSKLKKANLSNLLTGKINSDKTKKPTKKQIKGDIEVGTNAETIKEQIVTLKLSVDFLQKIQATMLEQDKIFNNPFFTAGSIGKVGEEKPKVSKFFSEMKERSKTAEANKPTKLNKGSLKSSKDVFGIEERPLRREEFHIVPESDTIFAGKTCSALSDYATKERDGLEYFGTSTNYHDEIFKIKDDEAKDRFVSSVVPVSRSSFDNQIAQKVKFLYNMGFDESAENSSVIKKSSHNALNRKFMWTELTRPEKAKESLIDQVQSQYIVRWFDQSFQLLDTNYDSKRRHKYLNEKFSGKQSRRFEPNDCFYDDFVVPDNDTEEENAKDDGLTAKYTILQAIQNDASFAPLMIISGPTGCGKTSCVYASAEELNAYVYEINSNQNHSRKYLQKLLKDVSTFRSVQQNKKQYKKKSKQKGALSFFSKNKEKEEEEEQQFGFQNGVILFENADVLFRSQDRGFWELFYSTLQFTRKPIVLTCSDLSMIPSNLVEVSKDQNTLIELLPLSHEVITNYLGLVSLKFGYQVQENILTDIATNAECDLRKSLVDLQYICQGSSKYRDQVIDLAHNSDVSETIEILDNDNSDNEVDQKGNSTPSITKVSYSPHYFEEQSAKLNRENEKVTMDLKKFAKYTDLLSCADVIETNTHSLLPVNSVTNKFTKDGQLNSNEPPNTANEDEGASKEGSNSIIAHDIHNDYFYDDYVEHDLVSGNDDTNTKIVKDDSFDGSVSLPFELNIGLELKKSYIPVYFMGYRLKIDPVNPDHVQYHEFRDDYAIDEDRDLYEAKTNRIYFSSPNEIINIFKLFLETKVKKFSFRSRMTRLSTNILSGANSYDELEYENINSLDAINTSSYVTIIVEIGPFLRLFAFINAGLIQRNQYIQLYSGLTPLQLAQSLLLKPLAFEPNPQILESLCTTSCLQNLQSQQPNPEPNVQLNPQSNAQPNPQPQFNSV